MLCCVVVPTLDDLFLKEVSPRSAAMPQNDFLGESELISCFLLEIRAAAMKAETSADDTHEFVQLNLPELDLRLRIDSH